MSANDKPSAIVWERTWDAAVARARSERRLILVDVERENCIGCELLDSVVYPAPEVVAAVNAAFVPLRLNIREPKVREWNVLWLPTVLILDHRGREHGRHISAAPAADFVDFLALGEAHARLKYAAASSRDRAEAVLVAALERRDDGPLHPELLYWLGIAEYFRGGDDHLSRDRVWAELLRRYPDSEWARRVPEMVGNVSAAG
jgi:hypothetical protein